VNASEPAVARVDARELSISLEPVADGPDGPSAGYVEVSNIGGADIGVWEHSVGTARHTVNDEVFVVISGRATVVEDGGAAVEYSAGDVGILRGGVPSTWTVHETLRKVYIEAAEPSA
jgi:uncharacterized cupin superfamily protein